MGRKKHVVKRGAQSKTGRRSGPVSSPEPYRHAKAKPGAAFQGLLSLTQSGFGFVTPLPGSIVSQDIFIPARYMGRAMDGDLVEVSLVEETGRFAHKGHSGRIAKIVRRERFKVVGEVIAGGLVRPLNRRIPQDIIIAGGMKGGKKGEWVEVELILDEGGAENTLKGRVIDVLGQVGTISPDLDAVVREYGLPDRYTEEQDAEAATILPVEGIEREDFTNRFCVAIDPVDAKDHDDAMSILAGKEAGTWEIGVHIADVAAFITPGSKWDKEARRRGFTAYLPGRTMPMLPRTLTKLLSLSPGHDSLAHSVIFTIEGETGKILAHRRCHSRIRIAQKVNYDQVQLLIDGTAPKEWDSAFCADIVQMVTVVRAMRKHRKEEEKFLTLATEEIRVLIDEEAGKILGMERRIQRESEEIVEDCMLAANAAVAIEMSSHHLPALYRTHSDPIPEKVQEFTQFMFETFAMDVGNLSTREGCNHFLENLPNDHRRPVILTAFLRAMARAKYSSECTPHFGLGKPRYLHFTSPIRRYPDLVVHQQLLLEDLKKKTLPATMVAELGEECSRKEEKTDDAYYAANDRMKLHYLRQRHETEQEDIYEAIVNRITTAGISVDIPSLGLMGFIERSSLSMSGHGQRFKRRGKGKLQAETGHTQYKCGDFIYIRLERIDFIRGSAYFRPAQ